MGLVKLTSAALDEEGGELILRGVLTPDSLASLCVADYQREVLLGKSGKDLQLVIASGSTIPDITLGMRGGSFTDDKKGCFTLKDKVFIIDGLQRTSAALRVMQADTSKAPKIGAIVYFNTTDASERVRFRQLNTLRTKLSPNVLLYNERTKNPQIKLLYELCMDSSFPLYQRVSWKQLMGRNELINASGLVRTAATLHQHFAGGFMTYDVLKLADRMTKLRIPRTAIRDNVKTFWALIDENWKVREITYKEAAPHIKSTFLMVLASMLNAHEDFWDDSILKINRDNKKKLAAFPLQDPEVSRLASSGGNAANILLPMLVQHMNSGKKLYRLRPFNALPGNFVETEEGGETWGRPS